MHARAHPEWGASAQVVAMTRALSEAPLAVAIRAQEIGRRDGELAVEAGGNDDDVAGLANGCAHLGFLAFCTLRWGRELKGFGYLGSRRESARGGRKNARF